ncbi:hypothetical protein KEM56_003961 [Ascosphaera pollenicola]|nr:hypothetical protein KEM56_003961 [Ascosphaera pollenicola]
MRQSIDSPISTSSDVTLADAGPHVSSMEKIIGIEEKAEVDEEVSLPPKDEDSFGLFQDFYNTHAPYNNDPHNIPVIGFTTLGLMYMGNPITCAAMAKWPTFRKYSTHLGAILMVVGLIAASFAKNVKLLILCQGVIYAIRCAVLYPPVVLFCDDWFEKKKGLAYGVICSGTGVAGVVTPIILSHLLKSFSLPNVFRIWALVTAVVCVPISLVVKPRVPDSMRNNPSRNPDLSFFKSKAFNLYQIANIIQGLGFFVPSIYLPLFARTVGFSNNPGNPLLVSLFNGFLVFGSIFVGFLTDRRATNFSILLTSSGAVLSVLFLWGFSVNLPILCLFACVYGISAGGYSASYAGIIRDILETKPQLDGDLMWGVMAAGRGIGSIACGPLSDHLLSLDAWKNPNAFTYGTGYGPLLVWVTITAAIGSMSCITRRIKWLD